MIPSCNDYRLLDYCFNDAGLDDDDTLKASIRMFMELDLLEKFRIDYEVSICFLVLICLQFIFCTQRRHFVACKTQLQSSSSNLMFCFVDFKTTSHKRSCLKACALYLVNGQDMLP